MFCLKGYEIFSEDELWMHDIYIYVSAVVGTTVNRVASSWHRIHAGTKLTMKCLLLKATGDDLLKS